MLKKYLRRVLGIERLGHELGSLKVMQVTHRERDAKLIGRLAKALEQVEAAVKRQTSELAEAAAVRNKQLAEAAAVRDKRHLEWAKDTAHMIANLRAETRFLLDAPGGIEEGEADGSHDPKVLRAYVKNSNIREVFSTELIPGLTRISIPLGAIEEESGHDNHVDLMYVVALATAREAKQIFEFGTYLGRTTYHLASISPDVQVHTLNLPPEQDPTVAPMLGRFFKDTDRERRITQLLVDSREFDPEPYKGQMDFIFIDADHSYELVKNDTEKALVMLRPGGTIVWHDHAAKTPGVVRYIAEFAQSRPVFRIKHTSLIVIMEGIDAMTFKPLPRLAESAARDEPNGAR